MNKCSVCHYFHPRLHLFGCVRAKIVCSHVGMRCLMYGDRREEWCTKNFTWSIERKKKLNFSLDRWIFGYPDNCDYDINVFFIFSKLICEMFPDVAICTVQTNQILESLKFHAHHQIKELNLSGATLSDLPSSSLYGRHIVLFLRPLAGNKPIYC